MSDYVVLPTGAMVAKKEGLIILNMDDPSPVTNIFPQHHTIRYQDRSLVSLPLHMDTVAMLKNLGFNTYGLEVLRHSYTIPRIEGVYDAMQHQVTTAAFLSENKRAFCTSTMRTGKTASTVIAADFLQSKGLAAAVLVVCTVSNIGGVWVKEIEQMLPGKTVVRLHGGSGVAERRAQFRKDADYYVINYDGVKMIADELAAAVTSGKISIVIVDEQTHYSNAKSQRWAAMNKVINGDKKHGYTPVPYAWGLTGTPGHPEKIYGQVKLINPTKMPGFFTGWRDSISYPVGPYKRVLREGYQETVSRAMQPCIRFVKEEIMDLPPIQFSERECELSAQQKKMYEQMKNDMIAYSASGEMITAATKSVRVTKLLQIATGAVKNGDDVIQLDMKNRLDVLQEIIEESENKVVIFCAYKAVIDRLSQELTDRGYSIGVVDGRVKGTKREKIFHDFQNAEHPRIGIFHPATTAFGVELAAADTMVFFGPPMSGDFVYEQAIERMSSLKQKAKVLMLVHLVATTEERVMFRSIKDGVSISAAVNKVFSSITKDFTQ